MSFAIYLRPECFSVSQPLQKIKFGKYSLPYYRQVCIALSQACCEYPSLAIRKAKISDYLTVHTHIYLRKLILKSLNCPLDRASLALPSLSGECQGLEFALPGYLYGLGGLFEALDQMKQGTLQRAYCFSMVGHHAHRDWGHGYCLLNPLAAAVRYAQSIGFSKVLMIDWDIHHGDGTQDIFSHDSTVYCISIHSSVDLYMAKASDLKLGTTEVAKQVGHCNIPIIPKSFPIDALREDGINGEFYYGDESLDIFAQSLKNLPWKPDLITIFAGYDSHRDDCGEDTTHWTNDDFRRLTELTLELAQESDCPVLSCHGGGYKLPVTVSAAMTHIQALAKFV